MSWRKSICEVLRDGTRRLMHPHASTRSYLATPHSIEGLCVSRVHCDRSKGSLGRSKRSFVEENLRSNDKANFSGKSFTEHVAPRLQGRNVSGTMEQGRISLPLGYTRIAGIHVGRIAATPPVESTYGVGPVGGADRDPKSKGDTPDDFRADYIHMAEPKEITKEKAAVAQEEPPDFQVKKMMPGWDTPVVEDASSQRDSGDRVFEGKTRKLEGTAQYKGETTGTESNERVEGQYGATPSEDKTTRS